MRRHHDLHERVDAHIASVAGYATTADLFTFLTMRPQGIDQSNPPS